MPKFYRVVWEDWNQKRFVNHFFADNQAHAETICEEISAISDASWRELKEDGALLTPASARYLAPALNESRWASFARLRFEAGAASTEHGLTVRAVKKDYVSISSKTSHVNPFTDLTRLKTSEGEAYHTFSGASYGRRNR